MTKLLLDESLPLRLAEIFPASFEVSSVHTLGWLGAKNGALLAQAAAAGFEALITADRNIEHQQNHKNLPCVIVVLRVHPSALPTLTPLIPRVVELCEGGLEAKVYQVAA